MLEPRIQQQFFDAADLQYQTAEALSRPIADAVQAVVGAITAGGKLLVCGVGGGAALAQHLAAALTGRFERDRPGLAALALPADATVVTSIAGSDGIEQLFARQVRALGQPGDLLLLLDCGSDATSGATAAVQAAHAMDMTVVALTGAEPGALREQLSETDVHVAVPHTRCARVMELHLLVLHCLADAVDLQLLGEQEPS